MRHTNGTARAGKAIWWLCGGALLILVGLVLYQVYVQRARIVVDEDLLRRLAEQTLDEPDDRALDPKVWPQWRGHRRDGVATAPDLLVRWPEGGPKELWRVPGGDGYSSFAVTAEAAFGMVAPGEGKEAVVAWGLADGKEKWRRSYTPGASYQYGGPRATPTVEGDRLYTVSSSGVLMCLKTADGEVIWQRDLVKELGGRPPKWGYAFSPLIEGRLVYALPGGNRGRSVAAFDKLTGELAWSAEDDTPGYSSPIAVTVGGVRQVVCFTGKRLFGVSADRGKLLWEYPWLTSFEVNAATPVHLRAKEGEEEADYLFISSGYSKGCALLRVVPGRAGKFAARKVYESSEFRCHFSSPVLYQGHLYGLDEADLACLDVKTGEVKWRKSGFQKGSLLRVDGRLIVLGERGNLALVECDSRAYRELARCKPLSPTCWAMPALADGRLFLRDQKDVVCLGVRR